MIGLLCFVLAVLAPPFKSKLRLEAENAVLRHQLTVLRRRRHGRVRLTNHDRWFLIQLYRWFPSILQVVCTDNLNTGVVVMKSAQDGARTDHTASLNRARNRRILVQGSMRSGAIVQHDDGTPTGS